MNEARRALGSLVLLPIVSVAWASPGSPGSLLDPRWLPLLVWVAWLGLRRLERGSGPWGARARRVYRLWQSADPCLAATLIYVALFRLPERFAVSLALWLSIAVALFLLRRASGPVQLTLVVALLLFGVALPRALRSIVIARVAGTYELGVDHRLIPDGHEINSDSARFRHEADAIDSDDFVVLFFGDSFTYGYELAYENSYPYQFERVAGEAGCSPVVRVVNFGWSSASPLLGLRLLKEVGYKYRPDLVLYNLDMTDFHDDLRYELMLKRRGDFELDQDELIERLVATQLPWAAALGPLVGAVARELRSGGGKDPELPSGPIVLPGPRQRYFITQFPLEKSRAGIELGVMRNLAEMHRFTRDVLRAEMGLVIYPRAYQYSRRESPRNWERGKYEILGRWVREPFRYFEEVADSLPYPVVSLLPAFEQTSEFPLYLADDPHWTGLGAAFAARALFGELSERGLLPCP